MRFSELGQCTDLGSPGPAVPQKAPRSSAGALPSALASGSCWPALCHCGLVVHFLGFPMNRPCLVCPPFAWLLSLAWLPGGWSRRCLQSAALRPPRVAASELVLHAPAGGPGDHHLHFGLVQCGCREDLRPSICVDVFHFSWGNAETRGLCHGPRPLFTLPEAAKPQPKGLRQFTVLPAACGRPGGSHPPPRSAHVMPFQKVCSGVLLWLHCAFIFIFLMTGDG